MQQQLTLQFKMLYSIPQLHLPISVYWYPTSSMLICASCCSASCINNTNQQLAVVWARMGFSRGCLKATVMLFKAILHGWISNDLQTVLFLDGWALNRSELACNGCWSLIQVEVEPAKLYYYHPSLKSKTYKVFVLDCVCVALVTNIWSSLG